MSLVADESPPKDLNGKTITVGARILYPTAKGGAGNGAMINKGTVEAIGEVKHRGYGYNTHDLKVRSVEDGKLKTVAYPKNCMLFEW
jgi:hypothetical protein